LQDDDLTFDFESQLERPALPPATAQPTVAGPTATSARPRNYKQTGASSFCLFLCFFASLLLCFFASLLLCFFASLLLCFFLINRSMTVIGRPASFADLCHPPPRHLPSTSVVRPSLTRPKKT
jgi:hypothetical protein